jgi:hypothetical protein
MIHDEQHQVLSLRITSIGTLSGSGVTSSTRLTYSVYRRTNGGADTLIAGPTAIAPTLTMLQYVFFNESYTTLHAPMRQLLLGSGSFTTYQELQYTGDYYLVKQCYCATVSPPIPREYTANAAGVAQGSSGSFDHTLLNRSALTLAWSGFVRGDPLGSVTESGCFHANSGPATGSTVQYTSCYAKRVGNTLELHGYAYAEQMIDFSWVKVQVHFLKTIYTKSAWRDETDIRELSGEVLPFADVTYVPSGTPHIVDATSATLTITAVL